MKTWGVPIFDWLAALDDGRGRWREGLWFDHAHPNSEGHRRMFESIDLSLFDTELQKGPELPPLMRRRSSLDEFDAELKRKTSRSSLDPLLRESQAQEQGRVDKLRQAPIFDDGRGFTMVLCQGAVSIRNKTGEEYVACAEWQELSCAMAASGLRPGTYVCGDEAQDTGNRVLLVDSDCRVANRLSIPAGTDAVFLPAFPLGAGRDR